MIYLPGLVKGPTGGKLASGLDDVIICTMSELEVSWTLKFKKKPLKDYTYIFIIFVKPDKFIVNYLVKKNHQKIRIRKFLKSDFCLNLSGFSLFKCYFQ